MTIEKLKSGNYRITQMVRGKRYRLTVDHKPTKREAEELMGELMQRSGTFADDNITFGKAAEGYIALKKNVLSPSTIVCYEKITRQISPAFMDQDINDLTQDRIQAEISAQASHLSHKSVANIASFIHSTLSMYRPQLSYNVTLPARKPIDYITPTEEQVRAILGAVEGTRFHIPFSLAVLSLRRSEICALDPSDLDGNILHIHKAKVSGVDEKWVVKEYGKTEKSNRKVYVPDDLAEEIRSRGEIWNREPGKLLEKLHRVQEKLGIPPFRFHDFRHYFASWAHLHGVPDLYIQEQGGWKTDNIMKRVYSHAFEEEFKDISKNLSSGIL